MNRFLVCSTVLTCGAACASAQYYQAPWQKNHFSVGLGVTVPQDDLAALYNNAVGWSFGYGYRFLRNFQADVGLDTGYNAANVNQYLNSGFGPLRIRDFQFFVPMGARAVIPLAHDRFELSAGGGGAYLRYSERLKQPGSYISVGCPICSARDGFGYYALAAFDYALDRSGTFKIGATTRVYQGHTNGAAVGLATNRTRDRWINSFFTFSVNF